jgi:guanylate kinase
MGKSSSGKDTIYNILKQKLDVNTYVMYTTRPMREEETNGVTYNFISSEEMQEYLDGKKKERVIESRTYQTVYGPWTYATIADSQFQSEKNMLMLGTIESYEKVKKNFETNEQIDVLPIYIEVPDNIRLKRAIEREEKQKEPKFEELCRRFIADSKDFSEEKLQNVEIKTRFQNMDLDKCVNEIMQYIKFKYENINEKNKEKER